MNLTRTVLRRPVTTVLCVLCLIVFGGLSIMNSKLELTPEMEMPMMVISTLYVGASPEDINDLVTKPVEDEVSTLSGIDSITSISNENMSLVLLQYEYGTDMDKAYSDLKKRWMPWNGICRRMPATRPLWNLISMIRQAFIWRSITRR